MDWTPVIAALITGLLSGGGVAAWMQAQNNKRAVDVDAWCKLIETQGNRLDTLNARVAVLEAQVEARDQRIDELEAEIDDLRDWIKQQGLTPPPRRKRQQKV